MQANAGGADDVLEGALFDHGLRVTCALVMLLLSLLFRCCRPCFPACGRNGLAGALVPNEARHINKPALAPPSTK
jgi:hypothetical protein